MKNIFYLNALYDIYGPLLTAKQQKYFEEYYFENLSLQEISENASVSKNAIYKQLKEIEKKLLSWEEKLSFHRKKDMILLEMKNSQEKEKICRILEE